MTIKGFRTLLTKRFIEKWGRFILASAGIMVGIWAITLTVSLSLGLSDTLVKAVNSQPSAKEFSIFKVENGSQSFFDLSGGEKFVPINQGEVDKLLEKNPKIDFLLPTDTMSFYLNFQENNLTCLPKQENVMIPVFEGGEENKNCLFGDYTVKNFEYYQDYYKDDWVGKKENLAKNELAVCYDCGFELNEKLSAKSPEEMIGKKLIIELVQAPNIFTSSNPVDFERDFPARADPKPEFFELTIASVIDDRDFNQFDRSGFLIYIDESYYFDKISRDYNISENQSYFINYQGSANKIEDLEGVLNSLKSDNYLVFSPTLTIVSAIQTGFEVVSWVLAGFGMIALIASIFGIINIMTISVLERKKEIGILKSLGATNGNIFSLFLIESMFLGFLGWIMGTLLAVGMGKGMVGMANIFINGNLEWKENLESLGVDKLEINYPVWLLLITLAIAIFFTSISGLLPARKAAKQNPVDVLRSE